MEEKCYTYRDDLYYFNYAYKVGCHREQVIGKLRFLFYKYIMRYECSKNVIYKYSKELKELHKLIYPGGK